MRNRLIILAVFALSVMSCTKQKVIDTGTYSGVFDMSMMDYLRTDDYNWKYTVEAIEHAGLTEMFENDDITFFGIKSHSIERYIYRNDKSKNPSIKNLPAEEIRAMLLKYVYKDVVRKEDIAFRNKEYEIFDPAQDGGTKLELMGGNIFTVYLETTPYAGVPDAGAIVMMGYSIIAGGDVVISTPNLTTNNGVVHALDYNLTFGLL